MMKLPVLLACLALGLTLNVSSGHSAERKPTARPYRSVVHHSQAEENMGVGLMLGEPTGISGKYFLTSRHAVDAAFAYSFESFFMLFGDYLWHWDAAEYFQSNAFVDHLKFYIGGGGGLKFSTEDSVQRARDHDDEVEFFVRVPFGMEWRMNDPALGFFFELAPGMKILPSTSAMFFADIGARFYF